MKKIMTGNYVNCKTGNLISISGDRGKAALYEGECMPELAPKRDFWQKWFDNVGIVPEYENTKYYIEEYYNQVLSKIDPMTLYKSLKNETILLCYEDSEDFCHRHLVAYYLELFLGINVSEVSVNSKRQTYHVLKRPEFLKDMLEDIIRENYAMNGYKSIRAAYLFNLSQSTGEEELIADAEFEENGYVLSL